MKEQTLIDMEKKSKNAMARLEQLEQSMTMLTSMLDKQLNNVLESQGQLVDTVNALLEVVGADAVQKVLTDKAYTRLAEQEKQVNDALLAGSIAPSAAVKPTSIIVYEEKDSAGNVRTPGKFYRNMFSLNPDARAVVEGKGVGFESPIGSNGSMKLLAIYDMVQPAQPPSTPASVTDVAVPVVAAEATPALQS